MHANKDLTSSIRRVLIFPARISEISGRKVFFLFSLSQVEDILMDASVLQVPFSPSHVDGVAQWRNCIMPVVSLEAFWEPRPLTSRKSQRLIVVRTSQSNETPLSPHRMMLRMTPPVRMIALPIESTPLSPRWVGDKIQTKGVYEWEHGILVVADIEKILKGSNNICHE